MTRNTTRRLDDRERRFVEEYLVDLDPQRAAIAAGYSRSMAASKVYQWVSSGKVKPHVFEAVRKAMSERSERTKITQDRVLEEYARLAFSDMRSFMRWGPSGVSLLPDDGLSADDSAAVAEVSQTVTERGGSLKLKLHDKKGALDSVAKHLGMFVDRHEHSAPGGEPLCIYVKGEASVEDL